MKSFSVFTVLMLFAAVCVSAQVETRRATSLQYAEQWKTIDRLMDGILPQSALPEIEKVRQAALRDKEYGQLIKAVMIRNTCLQLTEKEQQAAVIYSLIKDTETIPFPAKAVVYSLAGEAFLNYYNQNRWNIYDRTALTPDAEGVNIETWDAARLIREIVHYYRLSLMEPAQLQKISIADFKEALEGDVATRYLRPTLYDFLAHRAIDVFMNNDLSISDFWAMDNPDYFADEQTFVKLTIPETNILAPAYLILKFFQELTAFRLTQNDINSLTDVNLKRYNFLKDRGNFDDADALYDDAMKKLVASSAGQKIWGKVAYTLAIHYKQKGERRVTAHNHYFVEAVNLCHKIEKNAPLKDDRKLATDMIMEITRPEINISIERKIIPNQPALALVTYRNLHTAYLNIYRCLPEEVDELYRPKDWKDDAPHFLSQLEKVASHTCLLPQQTDYQHHSFETKIDTLSAGNYLFVVSDKPHPEKDKLEVLTYQTVQATNIKLLQRNHGDGKIEAYAVDARSGKPLQNAKISVIRLIYDSQQSKSIRTIRETVNTDNDGTVLISNSDDNYMNELHIAYGDEELTENMLHVYNRSEQPKNVLRTVFFTDRAIYRPGQTLYFKGLLYETDNDGQNEIKPNTNTIIQLIDVNSKEVFKQELATNEFGSFNGSFTLPQGLLNGQMTIRNEYGNVGIRVEEYKRPTFEVTMNPITAGYMLGDTITMTGTALALAGYPVDGAKASFKVVRYQQFHPLLRRMIYPPRRSNRNIATGKLYTNNKGEFTIKFLAKAEDIKPDDNSIYRYQMTVDVTDINGETQSDIQEVSISRVPLLIDCRLPEKIFVDEQSVNDLQYPLKISNLNGNEVAAEVQVEIWVLKSPGRLLRDRLWQRPDTTVIPHDEFTALFPNDPYNDEDQPATYEKVNRMAAFTVETRHATSLQPAKIDLDMLRNAPPGWYFIKLKTTAQHREAIIVEDSAYIQLQQSNAPIMHINEWLTVVKNKGEPGDMAVFRIAGGSDSSLVRYELLLKNQVVERKWLTVGRIPQELNIPVTETCRGGFAVAFAMVQDNREYTALHEIRVPYTNKELDIAFSSFRGQLLPGEKEKWTLAVKNDNQAEMVATLYDASLEQFVKHNWNTNFYSNRSHYQYRWRNFIYPLSFTLNWKIRDNSYFGNYQQNYEQLKQENWGGMRVMKSRALAAAPENDEVILFAMVEEEVPITRQEETAAAGYFSDDVNENKTTNLTTILLRTNFSETAFFYPELRTNEKGELLVEFTIPEALTRWNMLGFAHTKDFKTGSITNSLITQKQVAISTNLPRFFREGDQLTLSAKINNLTEKDLNGNALLRFYDAFTMQPVDAQILKTAGTQPFSVKAGQSAAIQWKLVIPGTLQAVTYRLTAQAGNHTDGEERSVPVLSKRTLVTETMPFMVRGDQRNDFIFSRLVDNNSTTLKHHRLTLEYTSNPAWYAVQALPYLMDYPYECAEQIFTRFYANALATTIANSSPKVKQIFNQWSLTPDPSPRERGAALISNLEKNQELKQALLEETPWVMQAANETERKKRIGLLFDLNRMSNEQKTAIDKLKALQGANGGFPWFAGMPEDRFVTQHIVAGLEHLRKLGALPRTDDIRNLIEQAMVYCDARISDDYKIIQRGRTGSGGTDGARPVSTERTGGNRNRERMQINSTQIHYLYSCSFSRHYAADQQAFDFYMQQAERSWSQFNLYEQAMIALTMHRFGKADVAQNILRSLKERAQTSDDMGMYWIDNHRGYFWNESPIETQAMLIEAFSEAGSDTRAVAEMKIWLLRNKQANDWKTTKATSEAIYALLSTGDELLSDSSQPLDIRIGGKPLKNMTKETLRPEAGTGNVNISWYGNEINSNLANLRITNPNINIAYGAMYWQYYEDMDKITSAETNLKMKKQLFVRNLPPAPSTKGGTPPPVEGGRGRFQVGDVVTVRLELYADRDYEYVHLKDMRAAGFEPVNVLSGYRFKGGLGYYESIKDASVNFFISYLRSGTYVFEYDLRVTNAGDFSNGITTFQCMYAPEFNAHSEGMRIKVN